MGLTRYRKILAATGTFLFIGMFPALFAIGHFREDIRLILGVAGTGVSGLLPAFLLSRNSGRTSEDASGGGDPGTGWRKIRKLLSTVGATLFLCTFPAMTIISLAEGPGQLVLSATCVGAAGYTMLLFGEISIRGGGDTAGAGARTGWREFRQFLHTIGGTLVLSAFPAMIMVFFFEGPGWLMVSIMVAAGIGFLLSGKRGSDDGDGGDGGDGGE